MSVREADNPQLFARIQEQNLLRQYDLLANCVDIGLSKGIEAFDKYTLWSLNAAAVSNIAQFGGRFREQPIYVGNHIPPHFREVPDLMDQFLSVIHENWDIMDHPTLLPAYALWRMNWIHPFIEGNGRTARAACYYLICFRQGGLLPGEKLKRASQVTQRDQTPQHRFILYVFGVLLMAAGGRLLWQRDEGQAQHGQRPLVRLVRHVLPMTRGLRGSAFWVGSGSGLKATPLVLTLVCIEVTDVAFAIDSIPAVFAVTTDPFIVLTSNLFAVLGLRSMYFLLANAVDRFRYLKPGLALILAFVGVRLLLIKVVEIPVPLSLGVIAALLLGSCLLSWLVGSKRAGSNHTEHEHAHGRSH